MQKLMVVPINFIFYLLYIRVMVDLLLKKLDEWSKNLKGNINQNHEVINFFEQLGYESLIWFTLLLKRGRIEAKSTSVPKNILEIIEDPGYYDKLLKQINNNEEIEIDNKKYYLISLDNEYKNGLKQVLLSNNKIDNYSDIIPYLFNIVRLIVSKQNKISIIEQTLNSLYNDLNQISNPEVFSTISLSEKFIENAVPVVIHSVLNEQLGPMIVHSIPSSYNSSDNLIFAVNVFATLDSEMLANIGQVYSTIPIHDPVNGEATNIIFTIANDNARGGYELHAISVFISQDFVGLSKSIYINLKSVLFSAIEQIRLKNEDNEWNLHKKEHYEYSDMIVKEIDDILVSLRKQIATFLASQISQDSVNNY